MLNTILHYAEDGVWQCWTCKNCVGKREVILQVTDIESIDRCIRMWLPECKVADRYMLNTNHVPCHKYCCDCEASWIIKEGVLHPLETDGICSHCGYTTGFYSLYKFCPNCGFHMEKMNND